MATHVLPGTLLPGRGILISLREAFSAHAAWMMEPEAARDVAATTDARGTGFAFPLLGDVRHTV